jgi:hypothetical protein
MVIGREKAYHGMHVAGTELAGIPVNHQGYGELMPDVRTVAWDSGKGLCPKSKHPAIGLPGNFPEAMETPVRSAVSGKVGGTCSSCRCWHRRPQRTACNPEE